MRPVIRGLLVTSLVAASIIPFAGSAVAGGDRHRPPPISSESVLTWNQVATQAAVFCKISPNDNPLAESRLYAMTQLAVYQAVDSLRRNAGADAANAAVASAANGVLTNGVGACAGEKVIGPAYRASLQAIPDGRDKSAGIAAGQAAAADVISRRSSDGVDDTFVWADTEYPQSTTPGVWRFTPGEPDDPFREFAFAPAWGTVTPFALKRAEQFAPGPPLSLTSRKYAADVNEIQQLGRNTNSTRSADQTQIAYFWVGSSPYQWNNIARNLVIAKDVDLWTSTRLFALMNMAMADGYISSFAAKYRYDFWRPVTAIREADRDGNWRTHGEENWFPLVATPPIPDYDSAHAVEGAAAAAVLESVLGRRGSGFSVCSITMPDVTQHCGEDDEVLRSFDSPSAAATENGLSRIYVGFHFRDAVEKGIEHGNKIGRYVVATALRTH